MRKCEKCGSTLVPGGNWYRLKSDYICCNCSSYPSYNAPARQGTEMGDYEELILRREEND